MKSIDDKILQKGDQSSLTILAHIFKTIFWNFTYICLIKTYFE